MGEHRRIVDCSIQATGVWNINDGEVGFGRIASPEIIHIFAASA